MREETVNRLITTAIEEISLTPLQKYLRDRIRFERSKMDRSQPYFKQSYREATEEFAPESPDEYAEYTVESLTEQVVGQKLSEPAWNDTDPIQIFEIRLNNWRQYAGEQTIELGSTNGRLINIIEGQNGAGKSNLLNAITLCFYGREFQEQSDNDDLEELPFVSQSKLDGAEPGEKRTGYIEVRLGVSGPEYQFRREFETKVEEDGSFTDSLGDLELRRKSDGEWTRTENPSTYLNEVLPAKVAEYFLFDGEDLGGFFDENYSNRVEEAILDVSHLELLNRSIYHLGKIRSDIEDEVSDVSGEAAAIREDLTETENDIKAKEEELERVSSDIEETQSNIRNINNQLKDVSDEYINRRYKEREKHRNNIQEWEPRIKELRGDIKGILVSVSPILYGADALIGANEQLGMMSETENIPPKIQRRFIDKLIRQGKCICGTEFDDESSEHDHLEELRQTVIDVSEHQLEDSSRIPLLFETAQEQIELLIEKRTEMARIEDNIDDAKSSIQDITNELKAHDIPDDIDVPALESNREELEGDLEDLREDRARLKIELEDLEEDQDEYQEALQAELDKQEEHKELRAQLSLVNLAEGCLKNIKGEILQELRDRTEKNIQEYFNQLIWKNEQYEVELAENYSISVIDEYGNNKIGSLSAGETQILALAFMAALTEISGFDAPVVIDTPLGRISSTPKSLIAKNLPRYMENTQITFLMTDEEYTSKVQSMMAEAVEREYRLVYENNQTTIIPLDAAQEVDA